MTFIDLFAGIGGFRKGLELAGHKCMGFCEWDKFAAASYISMHLCTDTQHKMLNWVGDEKRSTEILRKQYRNGEWYVSDIRKVTGKNVPRVDLWTFGAPCFVAGTMVATQDGDKPIETVAVGDMVLTHKCQYQKVLNIGWHISNNVYEVQVSGFDIIRCSGNHRFYVKDRVDSEPEWRAVEDFIGNEFLYQPLINTLGRWHRLDKSYRVERCTEIVYNLEVETDNSYCANGIAVHNCQDFSLAGHRLGLEGDRSSLVREVFRIILEMPEDERPEWLIYENVKGMLSSNNGLDYLSILMEFDECGYECEWQLFNSKDWGVPQNRERVYTIGHLKAKGHKKCLPIIELNAIDADSRRLNQIGYHTTVTRDNSDNYRVFDPNGLAPCLNTMQGGNRTPNVPICLNPKGGRGDDETAQPSLSNRVYAADSISCAVATSDFFNPNYAIKLNQIADNVKHDVDRIFMSDGIAPCLTARDFKDGGHKVCIPVVTPERAEKRQNGRRFKENGDAEFTLTAQDIHGVAIGVDPPKLEYLGSVGDSTYGDRPRQGNRIVTTDGIAATLSAEPLGNTGGYSSLYALKCDTDVLSDFTNSINENVEHQQYMVQSAYSAGRALCAGTHGASKHLTNTAICAIGNMNADIPCIWYEPYGCYIVVRKLTPKECFRLQGWSDEYFEKAKFVNSDSQLYKQAGNGVTVNVVYQIGLALNQFDV